MIADVKAVRITGIFHRDLTPVIVAALIESGISEYQIAAARTITLRETKGIFGIFSDPKLTSVPADVITLLVSPELEVGLMNLIIRSGNLATPGRGSVFTEDVTIYRAHELCREIHFDPVDPGRRRLQKELTGICCILQRGEGDTVARVALDTGTCVPTIVYGHGTGVRDKLGLLRVTIPAEKEVAHVIASTYDAEMLMNMMIYTGKLNQPGKGFVYLFPVRTGQINMKVIQGMPRHAASMEQIIVAIDEIKGDVTWRARGGFMGTGLLKRRNYLRNMSALTYTCNEGKGDILIKIAMQSGAPGATVTRTKFICPPDSETAKISTAREVYSLIMPESQIKPVVDAMEANGALDDAAHGQFCVSTIPLAYTFIRKK